MQTAKASVFDFVLVGSSIKAGIVAGLLAKEHRKRVCLIMRPSIRHQLAREFDLSFDCATRPDTWELLAALNSESNRLLTSVGGGRSVLRLNPLMVCHSTTSADALAHMYHVMRGYGYEVERADTRHLPRAVAGLRMRGARMVQHNIFWPALLAWLENCGVEIVEPGELRFGFHRDGSARVRSGNTGLEAGRLVLADEGAVLRHASRPEIERFFLACRACAVLSVTSPVQRSQFTLSPEHKFAAFGRAKGRIEFLGMVEPGNMAQLINANMAIDKNSRRSAQSTFCTLVTRDGAPMVGKLGRSNLLVLCGFGHAGAYFAPALARYLAGKGSQMEKTYFAQRGANSGRQSNAIAEFQQIMGRSAQW